MYVACLAHHQSISINVITKLYCVLPSPVYFSPRSSTDLAELLAYSQFITLSLLSLQMTYFLSRSLFHIFLPINLSVLHEAFPILLFSFIGFLHIALLCFSFMSFFAPITASLEQKTACKLVRISYSIESTI